MELKSFQPVLRGCPPYSSPLKNVRFVLCLGLLSLLILLTIPSKSSWINIEYGFGRAASSTFQLTQIQQPQTPASHFSFLPVDEAQKLCQGHNLNVYPTRQRHRKVYDLFLIGTEMDWAEIRLHELAPHVDYFVILESPSTFTNHSKPLYFKQNWSSFATFVPQIIYHVLNEDAVKDAGTWDRERYQRNALIDQVFPSLLGPQMPNYGDIILVSDVDEIPRPETITALRNCDIPTRVTINSRWYLYSFQWHAQGDDWFHPQATYWQGFENTPTADSIRMAPPDVVLKNASWSCTTCFRTVAQFINKINSFSHQEFNQNQFTDAAEIVNRVRNGIDVFDRADMHYEKVIGNLDVPEYLRRHQDRFTYLMNRDPPNANFIDWDVSKGTLVS